MASRDVISKDVDRRPISLSESASWDERLGVFRVKVQGNRDVGTLVILRSAPLPISHLDDSTPQKRTRLGQFLRDRLEVEVNAAVTQGSHQVCEGLALLGRGKSEKI